jgi:hypothetical protein
VSLFCNTPALNKHTCPTAVGLVTDGGMLSKLLVVTEQAYTLALSYKLLSHGQHPDWQLQALFHKLTVCGSNIPLHTARLSTNHVQAAQESTSEQTCSSP